VKIPDGRSGRQTRDMAYQRRMPACGRLHRCWVCHAEREIRRSRTLAFSADLSHPNNGSEASEALGTTRVRGVLHSIGG